MLFVMTSTTTSCGAGRVLAVGLGLLALRPAAAQTLIATGGATVTVQSGAALYVEGGVQNASGATLTNAGTLQVTGDLTNAGTLASPGTLLFSGTADQTFAPGAASVGSLTLANTGAAGANRLLLTQDLSVNTLLTLTRGLVRTQAPGGTLATLSLPDGASLTGEQSGRYVQGRLAATRGSVGGSAPAVFPNGFTLNPNGQTLGTVTVTRTAGLQTAGLSYGTNVGGTTKGIDRVWQVGAEQAPTAPLAVTLSWVADDDNGFNPTTPAQLWRADQPSGPWAAQGAAGSASARSFTANATQLGALTVSNSSQPLPVQLISFTAEALGPDGLLRWQTASELKNDRFEIESSVDGRAYQRLGQVAGHGTSTLAHSYQFVDKNLARYAAGQVYYRLRQVDTDGASAYSPVRTLAVPLAAGLLVQAYPNPSAPAGEVTLAIRTDQAGTATLSLTDVLGRQLGQQQVVLPAGASTVPLAGASELVTGVYLLRVQQGSYRQVLKLVRR